MSAALVARPLCAPAVLQTGARPSKLVENARARPAAGAKREHDAGHANELVQRRVGYGVEALVGEQHAVAGAGMARGTLRAKAMVDTGKIAKNLERFAQAVAAHDRENPTHTAYGIGLSHFDLERLGLEEGEEILPGIRIEVDGGVSGNFRVLCDGDHDEELEESEAEEEIVEAVAHDAIGGGAPHLPRFLPEPRKD